MHGSLHVVKVGGNELEEEGFLAALAQALGRLAPPLLLVHGGGRAIARLQARLGLAEVKVDGLRVTDAASLAVAEMVLSGQSNKRLVRALLAAGIPAVGLSGVDGGLLRCRKKQHPAADLGLVGEITAVEGALLHLLLHQGYLPVISPISLGEDGQAYNVNADEAAAALAVALGARALSFVSNVPGVMAGGRLLPSLDAAQAEALMAAGIIAGGMVPKVKAALQAASQGVAQARIVDLPGLEAGGTRLPAMALPAMALPAMALPAMAKERLHESG